MKMFKKYVKQKSSLEKLSSKRRLKQFLIGFIVVFFLGAMYPSQSRAETLMTDKQSAIIDNITEIVNQENISDEDVAKLESELSQLGIDSPSYFTPENPSELKQARGYGQTHDLGQGWKARVDKPKAGAKEQKPHVHVYKGKVEGIENVDGTKSHGKTLNEVGVPKSIQKKAKALKDYKKGQEDLKEMEKAKDKIEAKKLNLKKTADIIIAIGIFVAVVGLVIFATSSIAAWGAFLLLI
jgi:hypothetical protein